MTEYWVSQGNKWCDFCKIYISNNPLSIRTHELGQRHKDSVAKRLTDMRKEKAEKEKEEKDAARALQKIEACIMVFRICGIFAAVKAVRPFTNCSFPLLKAKRSYQKDLAAFQEARDSQADEAWADTGPSKFSESSGEWKYDSGSGYYYNQASGYFYDQNSGMYYSDALGKWVKYEDIANHSSSGSKQKGKGSGSGSGRVAEESSASKYHSGPPPGLVVKESVNPKRSVKGAPSSIALNNKRKRDGEKKQAKVVSKEEADALKAREAAKKRVEEREKTLLGLYKSY
ncbi:hypothetical protein Sjap_022209 [Stephania japonica]|uniref:Matrin-type domain-containing protein n=1 Tax=Stephania japonica TaxID=461633 RepID=A0AAP0ERM4_9MAGN